MSDFCEHWARIPQLVRCELEPGHAGDHRGNRGRIDAWSHRADLPSAAPVIDNDTPGESA